MIHFKNTFSSPPQPLKALLLLEYESWNPFQKGTRVFWKRQLLLPLVSRIKFSNIPISSWTTWKVNSIFLLLSDHIGVNISSWDIRCRCQGSCLLTGQARIWKDPPLIWYSMYMAFLLVLADCNAQGALMAGRKDSFWQVLGTPFRTS